MIEYQLENQFAVLRWNLTNQPMNVINSESIAAFEAALRRAYDDPAVRGLVITSARKEFVAGADLKQTLTMTQESGTDSDHFASDLQRVHRLMETSGKPHVAAINGTTLGGGLEICLACQYRLALDVPGSVIGLPEVTIGLLPGAGGTQRLPRLLGLERALPLLLEGRRLNPREAYGAGIVHRLVQSPEELVPTALHWLEANPDALQPWDERDASGRVVAKAAGGAPDEAVLAAAEQRVLARTHGNYPAPLEILACLREGLPLDIDGGLAVESRRFVALASGAVAKSLIRTQFFGVNKVNKGAARPAVPPVPIRQVALVGDETLVAELRTLATERGLEVVPASDEVAVRLEVVGPAPETVPDSSVVRLIVRKPVSTQAVIELIRTPHPSDEALASAFDFVRTLRKTPLIVGGEYVARCAATYADEGQQMWDEGLDPDRIQVAGIGAGMPAGPLPELAADPVDAADITPDGALIQRLLYRQALEAQRCLEEGIIDRLQADVGALLGWGFPAYTGGPISFIETEGVATFVNRCDTLADLHGERFRPTPDLRAQAQTV
jgi:enoyl-CoA hydratase/carnithine racemase